jgi:hypothetical protein
MANLCLLCRTMTQASHGSLLGHPEVRIRTGVLPQASAFFTKAFSGEARGDEIRAASVDAQLFAVRLDFDGLANGFEAEPSR